MVGNVTIQGQIVGTATFDGAKISAVVTIAPPINATVVFGRSGVTIHNKLTERDAVDAHPKESITDLTISDSPEFANTQITTLDSVTNGGIMPTAEATWLGATAKSVLSYLQKLVSKVYAINSRVAVLEDDLVYEVLTTAPTASINISLDKNSQPFLLNECRLLLINPSATTSTCTLRVNGNSGNIYNGYSSVNAASFVFVFGQEGNFTDLKLFYDNSIKTVGFTGISARKYPTNSFGTFPAAGFTNFGQITVPINSLTLVPASGNFPIGTKVILKKK